MSNNNGKLILGLEAGLAGGSVSVNIEPKWLGSLEGEKDISRSEDLLLLVEELLAGNNLKKQALTAIIVSDGPGSATGIRIALATAKGLSDALGIPLHKISILDAMAGLADVRGDFTAAVVSGKSGVYLRDYKSDNAAISPVGDIFLERDVNAFLEKIQHAADPYKIYVLDEELELFSKRNIKQSLKGKKNLKILRGNPAAILVEFAMRPIMSK